MNALSLHPSRAPVTGPDQRRPLSLVPPEPAFQISPERRLAAQKAQRPRKKRSVAKTTSPFELYGVCRPGGWLDGGGKRHRWSNAAFPPQRPSEGANRIQQPGESAPTRQSNAPPQPDSFGSLATTAGAPIRTGGASPLRVATGGDASFEARKPSPPLAPPVRIHGARTSLDWPPKPSPFGLRQSDQIPPSKLDSNRTLFYE